MKQEKLSVIIPFAQEYPQVAFTVQAVYCELRDRCDFEIIVIDNYCAELQDQFNKKREKKDSGGEYLSKLADSYRPWLKYTVYDKKLSHWQAKNAGVKISDGEFLWFCDAHCVPSQGSVIDMFNYYRSSKLQGSLHLPISYMLERPGLELIYKLVTDTEQGIVHYSFSRYKQSETPYDVPCMSTCGMMLSRDIYDKLGGWPEELGIYGGGENFLNFTMAILGLSINIFPVKPLFHYAAPRGYSWNYNDYHRNRCIATYMFGGENWAHRYINHIKGSDTVRESIFSSIIKS
ncbi:MAG: glycosyltransferase, partial [Actinobacteria bacterium]|nr:glycosyltransferase [Actinomycetota bacterium]